MEQHRHFPSPDGLSDVGLRRPDGLSGCNALAADHRRDVVAGYRCDPDLPADRTIRANPALAVGCMALERVRLAASDDLRAGDLPDRVAVWARRIELLQPGHPVRILQMFIFTMAIAPQGIV